MFPLPAMYEHILTKREGGEDQPHRHCHATLPGDAVNCALEVQIHPKPDAELMPLQLTHVRGVDDDSDVAACKGEEGCFQPGEPTAVILQLTAPDPSRMSSTEVGSPRHSQLRAQYSDLRCEHHVLSSTVPCHTPRLRLSTRSLPSARRRCNHQRTVLLEVVPLERG